MSSKRKKFKGSIPPPASTPPEVQRAKGTMRPQMETPPEALYSGELPDVEQEAARERRLRRLFQTGRPAGVDANGNPVYVSVDHNQSAEPDGFLFVDNQGNPLPHFTFDFGEDAGSTADYIARGFGLGLSRLRNTIQSSAVARHSENFSREFNREFVPDPTPRMARPGGPTPFTFRTEVLDDLTRDDSPDINRVIRQQVAETAARDFDRRIMGADRQNMSVQELCALLRVRELEELRRARSSRSARYARPTAFDPLTQETFHTITMYDPLNGNPLRIEDPSNGAQEPMAVAFMHTCEGYILEAVGRFGYGLVNMVLSLDPEARFMFTVPVILDGVLYLIGASRGRRVLASYVKCSNGFMRDIEVGPGVRPAEIISRAVSDIISREMLDLPR